MMESLMPQTWRVFLPGVLCGAILMAVSVAAWVVYKSKSILSPEQAAYDDCLKSGRTIRDCAATLRTQVWHGFDRRQGEKAMEAFEKAIKEEVEKRLSSGASKREVVQWAKQNAFVGKALSDAVGISLKNIEDDNY